MITYLCLIQQNDTAMSLRGLLADLMDIDYLDLDILVAEVAG